MKKILKSDLPLQSGKIQLSSAAEYIKHGVYGYLLETPEELDETCFFGCAKAQCLTCSPEHCTHFEEWDNGEPIDMSAACI